MSAGFPNNGQIPRPRRPSVVGAGFRENHLSRLGPLINELIAHDLVHRTDTGVFLLREDVQRHLEKASERRTASVAEVYIGRSCGSCGALAATRLTGGVRLCGPCGNLLRPSASSVTQAPPGDSERQRARPRRVGRAS